MAKKAMARKKATDGKLAATAQTVGRTLGRAARGLDKVKAAVKKAASARRGTKKPKKDPAVEAKRAKDQATWKSRAKEANAAELAKHGALVDERARVRSTMGTGWANRKPR